MKSKFEDAYKILNKAQKKAVDTIDGPVFVMAGPGTGKTQILTLRIANILKKGAGVDPENILALTFTNTASYNMRDRLSAFIGSEYAHRVQINTFHSFAEEMIKSHIDFFPEFFSSRMVSEIEKIEILEDILDNIKTKYFSVFKRRSGTMSSLIFSIDKIKNEGLDSEEFKERVKRQFNSDIEDESMFYKVSRGKNKKGDIKKAELLKKERQRDKSLELAEIYDEYQKALVEKGLYDFSDIILYFILKMKENSDFKAEMQERFLYILVDEHQDTNDSQNTIIHELIDNPVLEGKPNLFVVGDDKQAIFRFAGASQESFNLLKEKVQDMLIIDLVHNYRSGQHILDLSQSLIENSDDHKESSKLKSFFEDRSGLHQYREFSTYKSELIFLAKDIKEKLNDGEDVNEFAVLYRNNKDVSDIRQIFDGFEIPYKDFSKINLLEDIDVLKLFLLFEAVSDLSSDEVLAKILYIDFLKFDVLFSQNVLKKFRNTRRGEGKSIFKILSTPKILKEMKVDEDMQKRSREVADFLKEAKIKSENEHFTNFFSWFVRESGYLEYLLTKRNSVLALSKLEKIFDEIKKESSVREKFDFKDFLYYLKSLKKHNIRISVPNDSQDGVSLMTLHGSKGLEFDNVYIVKALAKRSISPEIKLPFGLSTGSVNDERRLFYVAVTRARKNLFISSYILNEEGKEKNKSQFIEEVGGIEKIDTAGFEKDSRFEFSKFFNDGNKKLSSITSQEYIEEQFLKSKLSVSAFNNYMESPVLYFFRNLILLPQARNAHLDFGNLVHGALEKYFNECIKSQEILGINVLKSSFRDVVESNYSYQDYEERGWETLSGYFKNSKKSFTLPLENEMRVNAIPFELPDGRLLNLTGVMDKVTRDSDGNITVWDYKTGKTYSSMDKGRKEKLKRQAVFYKLLLREAFGGRYDFKKAVFDFVEKSEKTGEYEQKEFEVTLEDVDDLRSEIKEFAKDVLSGDFLKRDYKKDEKTKEYLELLDSMFGDPKQGDLFGE